MVMTRLRLAATSKLVLAAALALSSCSAVSPDIHWNTYSATPADGFVDTVGVSMHEAYVDTAYGNHDLLELLDRLGVRHIRDAAISRSMPFYRRFVEQSEAGAGVSYIVDSENEESIQSQILMVANEAPETPSQIESQNEPDCDGWTGSAASKYRKRAREMRSLIESLPSLQDVPLATPSFCWVTAESYMTYGDDGASKLFNMHLYFDGSPPEPALNDALELQHAAAPRMYPVITETGYHNAMKTSDGHAPTSESAVSAYLPQALLEAARRGVVRTYVYELIDLRSDPRLRDDQAHFGLYRADGTLKPAGASLATLLNTLKDPGPPATPRDVRLSIQGADDTVVVQPYVRSDGSFDVVLWRRQKIWDPARRIDIANPAIDVTVGTDVQSRGSLVKLGGTEEPLQRELPLGNRFELSVDAHPVILRVDLDH